MKKDIFRLSLFHAKNKIQENISVAIFNTAINKLIPWSFLCVGMREIPKRGLLDHRVSVSVIWNIMPNCPPKIVPIYIPINNA